MFRQYYLLNLMALFVMAGSAQAQVFWTYSASGTDEIQRSNLPGPGFTAIVSPTVATSPWAIGLNVPANQVYWSNLNSPSVIYRSGMDGSSPTSVFTASESIISMAVNPTASQLYLLSNNSIYRSDLNGGGIAPIVTGLLTSNSIAIDVPNGHLYWTEQAANRIGRANLDGSNVTTIVNTTYAATTTERGITLDAQGGLYWVDSGTDNVYKVAASAFTGTPLTAQPIVNLATLLGAGASPNGMASDGQSIYWAEGQSGFRGIYRADLDGANAASFVIPGGTGSPIGVAAVPVPEPGSLVLAGGAAVIGWLARCRRRL